MNHLENLIRLFSSTDTRFFMRRSDYIAELASLLPYILQKKDNLVTGTYVSHVNEQFKSLNVSKEIRLTNRYDSEETADSLAYYRIQGAITSDNPWRFASKTFEQQLLQSEANPNIIAHFVHVTSGGGEAWYLDQLATTIRSLTKPKFAFIERVAASAGYYIASQFDRVTTNTPYDIIGCIGTMVSIIDLEPMFEKFGVKFIKEYATNSDLKNKKYNDLMNGYPEQFIEEELNPLQLQFVADVRKTRSKIAVLSKDHPVLRGETFLGSTSLELGLVDGIEPFQTAIYNAYTDAISSQKNNLRQRKRALALLQL